MIKYQGISTLEILEGADRYNKWIAESLLPYISTPVLEIGSGIGNISSYFLDTDSLFLSDKDEGLVKHLQNKFGKKGRAKVLQIDITDKIQKKFESYFSTIVAINVLEHIEDDIKAFANIKNALKKDGKLLLLVPAKRFAYTRLDKELGHFRRYEKQEITKKLQNAGYIVEDIYYFNFVGLISWFMRDKITKNYRLKPYHISIFDNLVPILKIIEKFYSPPIGISFIIRARKI